MTFFPEISDYVTILRGRHAGKVGVVKAIESSQESPIYVVDINPELNFADWLRPDDIERFYQHERDGSDKSDKPVGPVTKAIGGAGPFTGGLGRGQVRQIVGRKIATAKTIDTYPVSAWRQAVAESLTYRGYTSWIDAIENGEDES